MTQTEIPAGTRAVVIHFTAEKKSITFDLLRQPYGVTLAQLTSNALNAMITAGFKPKDWTVHFSA